MCIRDRSKAGLCYNAEANLIQDRIRDWIVEMPENGFLFPLFNDRSTDIHGMPVSYTHLDVYKRQGQKAVRACTIRLLNLGHAKYEKVAIYAVNQRISNIWRIAGAA